MSDLDKLEELLKNRVKKLKIEYQKISNELKETQECLQYVRRINVKDDE